MSETGKKLIEHLRASGDTEAARMVEIVDQLVDNQASNVESLGKIMRQQETLLLLIDRLTSRVVALESMR